MYFFNKIINQKVIIIFKKIQINNKKKKDLKILKNKDLFEKLKNHLIK